MLCNSSSTSEKLNAVFCWLKTIPPEELNIKRVISKGTPSAFSEETLVKFILVLFNNSINNDILSTPCLITDPKFETCVLNFTSESSETLVIAFERSHWSVLSFWLKLRMHKAFHWLLLNHSS